jgi:hypothetical protein
VRDPTGSGVGHLEPGTDHAMSTRVTVLAPFQCVHGGTVYGPGQTAEVPDTVAREWVKHGWAERAEKPEPKSKSKTETE